MVAILAQPFGGEPDQECPRKISQAEQEHSDEEKPKGAWEGLSLLRNSTIRSGSDRRFAFSGEKEHGHGRKEARD